jgi:hypothetical protein
MRFSLVLLASLAAGEIHINYDPSLDGRLGEFEVEEMVFGTVGTPSKPGEAKNPLEQRDFSDAMLGRAAMSPDGAVGVLDKRQLTCETGYGYCSCQ